MMQGRALLGAVLAGGESRRYGRDKARELLDGKTLVERALDTLASVFDEVVVLVGPADREASRGARPAGHAALADLRQGGLGPLAGLEAALARAEEQVRPGVFVLACDLPLVTPGEVERLVAAWDEAALAPTAANREASRGEARPGMGAPAGVVAPTSTRFLGFEPLCAVYGTSCLADVRRLLDSGQRAAHTVFDACGGRVVELEADVFLNVNTPADREAAERLVKARRA